MSLQRPRLPRTVAISSHSADSKSVSNPTTTTGPVLAGQASPSTAQQGQGGLGSLSTSDFLDLLVAQITNQDPLSPVSSSQFLSETAELSTLEQIAALNQETSQVLGAQQLDAAIASIGRTVSGTGPDGQAVSGTVTGVLASPSGPLLEVGGNEVPMSDITTID